MDEQLTTRQVADALQVSESSVKRWCNRGVIPTMRTVGGHRRIPLTGLMEFLESTNRKLVAPLTGNSTVRPQLEDATTESRAGVAGGNAASLESLKQQFGQALVEGDLGRCRAIVMNWYAKTECVGSLADELVADTMQALGDQWDCGQLEIYQERRGCEICSRLVHEFERLIPAVPSNAPLAIGGSPAGDQYSLPTQLAELVLRESGWQAENLGVNLPLETLSTAVWQRRPRLLWLSVSHLEDESNFVASCRRWLTDLPDELMVVVGGRALNDRLRPQLNYTAHCDNMVQLGSFARALHGRPDIRTSNN